MSSYTYCAECGTKINEPTVEEVMDNKHECPSCGTSLLCAKTIEEVIIDMSTELVALRNNVEELKRQVSVFIFEKE